MTWPPVPTSCSTAPGRGTCLEVMESQQAILVDDFGSETRWGDCRLHVIGQGRARCRRLTGPRHRVRFPSTLGTPGP